MIQVCSHILSRSQLPDLVKGRTACPLMIELGVAKGQFSFELLRNYPNLTAILIDKWNDHHDLKEYTFVTREAQKYGNRVQVWRGEFREFSRIIPDGCADLIYVDGYAHTGQEDGQTIKEWYQKVQRGGIFSGHDYHSRWQPTISAVDRFLKQNGLTDEARITSQDEYPSWYVRKP